MSEENIQGSRSASADEQLLNLRVKISRIAAVLVVSAGMALLMVSVPSSRPPRRIQSFSEAFVALAIFGGLFVALVDYVASLLRRAIWGKSNAALPAVPPFTTATPIVMPFDDGRTNISRARFWTGLMIVLVIGAGMMMFGVQSQRLAAQEQQRRDCVQLGTLRIQENRPPLPPPPPPLPPGMKVNPELEQAIKKLEEQRQKLTEQRHKWETTELPKIRARRTALEKKLASVQCEALLPAATN